MDHGLWRREKIKMNNTTSNLMISNVNKIIPSKKYKSKNIPCFFGTTNIKKNKEKINVKKNK